MKKIVLILLITLSYQVTFSQSELGIQVGVGLSKFTPAIFEDGQNHAKFSYLIGAYYEIPISEKMELGTGLNLNYSRGDEDYHRAPSDPFESDYRSYFKQTLTNLSIPAYLKINANEKIYFDLGLRFSFNLGGEMLNEDTYDGETVVDEESTGDMNVDKFIIGGQYGFGYNLKEKIKLEFLFYHDYSNLLNDDATEEGEKLKTWQAHIVLKYVLK